MHITSQRVLFRQFEYKWQKLSITHRTYTTQSPSSSNSRLMSLLMQRLFQCRKIFSHIFFASILSYFQRWSQQNHTQNITKFYLCVPSLLCHKFKWQMTFSSRVNAQSESVKCEYINFFVVVMYKCDASLFYAGCHFSWHTFYFHKPIHTAIYDRFVGKDAHSPMLKERVQVFSDLLFLLLKRIKPKLWFNYNNKYNEK